MPARARAFPCVLLLLLLAGCSSSPDHGGAGAAGEARPLSIAVQEGDPVVVEYRGSGATLALCNAKAVDAMRNRLASATKLTGDADLRKLLQAFDALSFFKGASERDNAAAKASLVVRVNDRTWVRERQALGPPAEAAQFNDCLEVFRYVYDTTLGFQTATDVRGADLKAEEERLQRAAGARARGSQ